MYSDTPTKTFMHGKNYSIMHVRRKMIPLPDTVCPKYIIMKSLQEIQIRELKNMNVWTPQKWDQVLRRSKYPL
jgi:hypothetical protein